MGLAYCCGISQEMCSANKVMPPGFVIICFCPCIGVQFSLQIHTARLPSQQLIEARYSKILKATVELLTCLKSGICLTGVLNWALFAFVFYCDNSVLILPVTKVNVYYLFSAVLIPYITSALQLQHTQTFWCWLLLCVIELYTKSTVRFSINCNFHCDIPRFGRNSKIKGGWGGYLGSLVNVCFFCLFLFLSFLHIHTVFHGSNKAAVKKTLEA